jgi:CRISPR-associated endoribonuclease Cas6
MPYAIVLPLRQTNEVPLPTAADEYAHAAFFDLLARIDPALATQLHDLADRKPFTFCLFREPHIDTPVRLRLTCLENALFPVLADALLRGAAQDGIRIGDAHFSLTCLLTTANAHPLAGSARYAELWTEAQAAETVRVRFVSPTVFRSQRRDILWPEPRLVWQSWARAWCRNVGSDGTQLDEARLVALAESGVIVERHRLQTRKVVLKAGGQMGFVGECIYSLRDLDAADRRALMALAHFAFYAGTGRKTAMGMGQTRTCSSQLT